MSELVQWGMLSEQQAQKIVQLVIEDKLNLFLVGATGSGKTTLLNALLNMLPLQERVITIEDSREIHLELNNYFPMVVNIEKGLTARNLVKLLPYVNKR